MNEWWFDYCCCCRNHYVSETRVRYGAKTKQRAYTDYARVSRRLGYIGMPKSLLVAEIQLTRHLSHGLHTWAS